MKLFLCWIIQFIDSKVLRIQFIPCTLFSRRKVVRKKLPVLICRNAPQTSLRIDWKIQISLWGLVDMGWLVYLYLKNNIISVSIIKYSMTNKLIFSFADNQNIKAFSYWLFRTWSFLFICACLRTGSKLFHGLKIFTF